MCLALAALPAILEAVSVASTVTSVAAEGIQYAGQQAAARAQQNYENQRYQQTAASATKNLAQQYASTQNQLNQQTAATQQQATSNTIAGQAAIGSAQAQQGARGVTGSTAHAALQNFARIEAANNTTYQTNLNWAQQQGYQNMLGYQAQAQSQINNATAQPVAQPSLLGAGLGIAGTTLNGIGNAAKLAQPTATGT